jgi:hypothetical protein
MNSRLPASHSIKHNTGVKSYSRIMKKKSLGLDTEAGGFDVDGSGMIVSSA